MSAATMALFLKTPESALMEKPASGRTVNAREARQNQGGLSESVLRFLTTGTNSSAGNPEMVHSHEALPTAGTPITQTYSVSTSGVLTSTDYALTLERIRSLVSDEDEEDRPSERAYGRALSLLRTAAQQVGMNFPRGIAATGPGQSVRLLWSGTEKELRVVIGGSETNRSYIYWRVTGDSGVEETLEGSRLAEYLNWIAQDA